MFLIKLFFNAAMLTGQVRSSDDAEFDVFLPANGYLGVELAPGPQMRRAAVLHTVRGVEGERVDADATDGSVGGVGE